MKKQIILLFIVAASMINTNQIQAQADPFIGEIVMFAGTFAPRGWALCEGQLLPISQYSALFSLLGTTYGGDGRTTFGLPDLRGRLAIHEGQGPGLTTRTWGAKFGSENETLTTLHLPNHNHSFTASTTEIETNTSQGEEGVGNGLHVASHINAFNTTPTDDKNLAGFSVNHTLGNTGGGQLHTNVQPTLVVRYIIALQGTFPSRN